jgi:FAD/FMN-containing dehydrogenase
LELKSRVRGKVLLPKEEGYDAERAGWNLAVEHHPKAIVVAASAEDVAAAVQYAASEGLPVGCRPRAMARRSPRTEPFSSTPGA